MKIVNGRRRYIFLILLELVLVILIIAGILLILSFTV